MFAVSFDFLIAFFQATEVSIFVVSSFLLKSKGKCGCFHVDTCRKTLDVYFIGQTNLPIGVFPINISLCKFLSPKL